MMRKHGRLADGAAIPSVREGAGAAAELAGARVHSVTAASSSSTIDLAAQRRRTMLRCQRRIVSG